MSRFALVFSLLLSSSAWGARDNTIAVLDVQGTGISPELLPTLTEILTVEIAELGMYKVIAGRDIQSMLGFEKEKDVLGCTEASCLAEIGGALGVERIVAGHIGMIGSTYVVNIKLINIRGADTEGRAYETVRGEVDALINTIRTSVRKLLGAGSKAAQAMDARPSSTPAPTTAPAPAVVAAKPEQKAPPPAQATASREPSEPVSSPAAAQAAPAPTVEATGPGRGIGVATWALWGVGAAAFVGASVTGVLVMKNRGVATGNEPGAQAAIDRAQTMRTITNVEIGVGLLAAGGGRFCIGCPAAATTRPQPR